MYVYIYIHLYTNIYISMCVYIDIYIYTSHTAAKVPGPRPSWNPPRRRVILAPLMDLLELRSYAICSINALCLYYMSIKVHKHI